MTGAPWQIGSELQAAEPRSASASQEFDGPHLGQMGNAFDRHVAAGHQQAAQTLVLALDAGGQLPANRDHQVAGF